MGSIYNTVYISTLSSKNYLMFQVKIRTRTVIVVARFIRGYAYFIALHTFGGVPQVVNTSIEENRNIPGLQLMKSII